jgi:hypothetical protein
VGLQASSSPVICCSHFASCKWGMHSLGDEVKNECECLWVSRMFRGVCWLDKSSW